MSNQEMEGKKTHLREHIIKASQLPQDVILGMPLMTLTGRSNLTLENFRGIIEYTETFIRIQTKIGQVRITGSHLQIPYYSNDELQITGMIHSIEYD